MNNEAICRQFAMTNWFLEQGLKDISHEDSLNPTTTGQTLNWVVGHLADSRNGVIAWLSGEPAWPVEETARYKRGSDAITEDEALPLEELFKRYQSVQDALVKHISEVTPEQAQEKAPFSPVNNPDETVGSLLATLAFHEIYHLGQIGMLRRMAGQPRVV
jgi:uncharacterized damage-inducible protein DinB